MTIAVVVPRSGPDEAERAAVTWSAVAVPPWSRVRVAGSASTVSMAVIPP